MRENRRIVALDVYEEGAVIEALNDKRTKLLAEQTPTDTVDEALLKVINAPVKKVRVRDEAR